MLNEFTFYTSLFIFLLLVLMFDVVGIAVPELILILIGVLWLASTILGTLFNVAMFVDVLRHKFRSRARKIAWAIVVIVIPFASLYYYMLFISDELLVWIKKRFGLDLFFILYKKKQYEREGRKYKR